MSSDIDKERLAVLESKVEDLRSDYDKIESKMDRILATVTSNKDMLTEEMDKLGNSVGKYATYNKTLWPIVTILVAVISWLLGTRI